MLIHTGAEKLKCDLCERTFLRKHDLKQHMFSHTQYVTYLNVGKKLAHFVFN